MIYPEAMDQTEAITKEQTPQALPTCLRHIFINTHDVLLAAVNP